MKDYLVQVRIKNGYMHRRMRERGFASNAALSRESGVHQSRIGEFLNLKSYPMSRISGQWLAGVQALANTLNCLPEEMFPPQHIQDPLIKNDVEFELNLNEVRLLERQSDPEALLLEDESRTLVHTALAKLAKKHPREAQAVQQRFFEDATLKEIADKLPLSIRPPSGSGPRETKTVSVERARQMVKSGIRDLKKILEIPQEVW